MAGISILERQVNSALLTLLSLLFASFGLDVSESETLRLVGRLPEGDNRQSMEEPEDVCWFAVLVT